MEAFAATYGSTWEAAVGSAAVLRNDAALDLLGVDGRGLERMWRDGVQLKLAPGAYVSRLEADALAELHPQGPLYTVNGFYPAMREQASR